MKTLHVNEIVTVTRICEMTGVSIKNLSYDYQARIAKIDAKSITLSNGHKLTLKYSQQANEYFYSNRNLKEVVRL